MAGVVARAYYQWFISVAKNGWICSAILLSYIYVCFLNRPVLFSYYVLAVGGIFIVFVVCTNYN